MLSYDKGEPEGVLLYVRISLPKKKVIESRFWVIYLFGSNYNNFYKGFKNTVQKEAYFTGIFLKPIIYAHGNHDFYH